MNRREFLQQAGLAAGVVAGELVAGGCSDNRSNPGASAEAGAQSIAIVWDPSDPVAAAASSQWAIGRLRDALVSRGVAVSVKHRVEETPSGSRCILVGSKLNPSAMRVARTSGVPIPEASEGSVFAQGEQSGTTVYLAAGSDVRGLSYALTDMAEAVTYGANPVVALSAIHSIAEQPANRVRGIGRLFTSDIEDKPWYNDRGFWQRYLSMLATARFNRFHLALGLGYDTSRGVKDSYFYFPYPFFLAVPGYDVKAVGLPDAERDNNLVMLGYIADQCAERGIDFQLGLWGHQYVFENSPDVNYPISGLTPQTHAVYCRDALSALLKACPNIAGVTFRIHGESGVAEGSYDFWKTVFDGIVKSGRRMPIEMHAKGSDQSIIDIAAATGMPVVLAPKYWAEHTGLPYVQSSIRSLELPRPDRKDAGFFAQSSGSRSFLRYGYGDLLSEDRKYDVVHRMWPGTQRMLLWGDPLFASSYSHASHFCGMGGAEMFEPLTFKGRMGAGTPGGRQGYADDSLKTSDDWEKYRYYYVLWGRMLYNPDTQPETWQRLLRHDYGQQAAPSVEAALASASRILPTYTTAHGQSASYNAYWVELTVNMPIVDPTRRHPFADTPSPKTYSHVSPLDPQLFLGQDALASQLLKGETSGKYNPAEVAAVLERLAKNAAEQLALAAKAAGDEKDKPAFRRMALDVTIQSGLGIFFAQKLRAGTLWAIYEKTGDPSAIAEAVRRYHLARDAWSNLADKATGAYSKDITYGPSYYHRGHWKDRLVAIDQDIADLEKRASLPHAAIEPAIAPEKIAAAISAVLKPAERPKIALEHLSPRAFKRGGPVALTIRLAPDLKLAKPPRLYYRRVNQAEAYQSHEMDAGSVEGEFVATIPGDYTNSVFPLQYYFELTDATAGARLFPGFNQDWSNQPYLVIRQSQSDSARV